MYKLFEKNNDFLRVHILKEGIYTFGRSLDNDIVINHKSVSRKHFMINVNDEGLLILKDNNSANGTFVNQKK